MLILDATTKSIELILSGVVTINPLSFVSAFIEMDTTSYAPESNDGTSNDTTAVTIVAAPAASKQRQIKLITIYNADTVSSTVTLRLNNNGIYRTICKVTLPTLAQLIYTDGEGFRVVDSNGNVLQSAYSISLTSQVTGVLPIANGGTSVSSLSNILGTVNGVDVSNGLARVIGGNVTLGISEILDVSSAISDKDTELADTLEQIYADIQEYIDNHSGGVSSITGTANQVIASASIGAVTLSLPQSIGTGSTPQLAKLGLGTTTGGNILTAIGNIILDSSPITGTSSHQAVYAHNTGGEARLGVESSAGGALVSNADAYSTIVGSPNTVTSVYLVANNILGVRVSSAGAIRFGAYGAGALSTDASGNVTATSDERLKKIKDNFTRGLAEILAIQPINYQWIENSGLDTLNTYTGFSAQNVLAYIPEAVTKQLDGHYGLLDRPILAALINAVKTLYAEVVLLGGKSQPSLTALTGEVGVILPVPASPAKF